MPPSLLVCRAHPVLYHFSYGTSSYPTRICQRYRVIVFIDGQLICLAKGIMYSYLTSLVEAVLVLSVYAPNEGLAINLQ